MSIILKGIDLPKHDEGICVTIWKDGIIYARDIKTDTTIETEAEAIQIPTPHGRILIEDFPYHKSLDAWGNGIYEEVEVAYKGDIYNAPTILEEEE